MIVMVSLKCRETGVYNLPINIVDKSVDITAAISTVINGEGVLVTIQYQYDILKHRKAGMMLSHEIGVQLAVDARFGHDHPTDGT